MINLKIFLILNLLGRLTLAITLSSRKEPGPAAFPLKDIEAELKYGQQILPDADLSIGKTAEAFGDAPCQVFYSTKVELPLDPKNILITKTVDATLHGPTLILSELQDGEKVEIKKFSLNAIAMPVETVYREHSCIKLSYLANPVILCEETADKANKLNNAITRAVFCYNGATEPPPPPKMEQGQKVSLPKNSTIKLRQEEYLESLDLEAADAPPKAPQKPNKTVQIQRLMSGVPQITVDGEDLADLVRT